MELSCDATKAGVDFVIANVIEVKSAHESFPDGRHGFVVELGSAGKSEFTSGNVGYPFQALDSPVSIAHEHFFPPSADDMQGLFGDAVSIRRKSIGVAFAGDNELEFKGSGSCHLSRDKRKGGSRELWFFEP